jgi:hypothetical protein
MPQPLTRPPKEFALGPDAINMRPKLAVQIAKVAAKWTLIENQQGVALALLLNSEGALAMYIALSGGAARIAALKAAAEHTLSSEFYKEFEEQLRATKGPQNERNTVIHSVWAASDDDPDALLQAPSKDHLKWFAARATNPIGAVLGKPGDEEETLKVVKKLGRELSAVPPVLGPRGRRTERYECIATACGEYSDGFTVCRTYMSAMGQRQTCAPRRCAP